MPDSRAKKQASWVAVNAYGAFVGALAVLLGVRYVAAWAGNGFTHAGHLGYIAGGTLLLVAYWRTRVDLEVYASVALIGSNVSVLFGRALADSSLDPWNSAVSAALTVFVTARVVALLRGGSFSFPPWGGRRRAR